MEILNRVCRYYNIDLEALLEAKKGLQNELLSRARFAAIFLLHEEGFNFQKIAELLNRKSKGSIYTQYKTAKSWYENNFYNFKEDIERIKSFDMKEQTEAPLEYKTEQTDFVDIENMGKEKEPTNPEAEFIPLPDPEEVSPLSEPVIERSSQRSSVIEEEEDIIDLDIPIPEFKTVPNPNPGQVTVKADKETIDFSTRQLLTIAEFASVELTYNFVSIDKKEVEEEPELEEVVNKANENTRKKLEETASRQIKLLEDPLSKVLEKRNVTISPESALVFGVIMFAFTMYITAQSIKNENKKLLSELKKSKEQNKENK
ncbi:MAG: hypothetical protein KatS3mg101_1171 [Patescibacteria group bacterium]|nr:MAG: hypothetical protein KatS3mg101_1171 [Patescibacteria group bacterium]